MRTLLQQNKTRWLLIALAAAVIAFVAGVSYGLRTSDGIGAQQRTPPNVTFSPPTDTEWAALAAQTPYAGELVIDTVQEATGASSMSKAEAEYWAAEPYRAIYIYPPVDVVIHLPQGVVITSIIQGISCSQPICADAPLYILKYNDEFAGVDGIGRVFATNGSIDEFSFLKDDYNLEFVIVDFVSE